MAKYRVTRPWAGVSMGQVIELSDVHPSIKPNLMPVSEGVSDADQASDIITQAHATAEALRKDTETELSKQIAVAVDGARAEAQAIVEAAQAEAQKIIVDARTEAETFLSGAVEQTTKLVPATPDATADKAKVTKTK